MNIDFVIIGIVAGTTVLRCPKCGCLVGDKDQQLHTDFHKEHQQVKDFMDRYRAKM